LIRLERREERVLRKRPVQPSNRVLKADASLTTPLSFVAEHGTDLIVRSPQNVKGGNQFFADGTLVKVFSATNYGGPSDSAGAVTNVDADVSYSFMTM
jgi:hypothetical protein